MNEVKLKIADYTSTQLELTGKIKKDISSFLSKTIKKGDLASNDDIPNYAQGGIIDYSHITILYGIKENQLDNIKNTLRTQKPIKVMFGKTNFFSDKHVNYDVVYLEVISSDLRKLRNKMENEVEYYKGPYSYIPHVSLAYVKKGLGKDYKEFDLFEGKSVIFDSIIYSSPDEKNIKIELTN